MRLLVLYTEMAGYFYSCLELFAQNQEAEVLLISWPVNKVAPFTFRENRKIARVQKSYFRSRKELLAKCVQFSPDIVYTAGWMDKDYLHISRHLRKLGKPVILGSDTRWRGTWRQRLATLVGPLFLKMCFNYMWVPGKGQYEYARRLGFPDSQVALGLYTADHPLYYNAYLHKRHQKSVHYPRKLLYIGRLAEEKGIRDLVKIFSSIDAKDRNGWTLDLYGVGPLQDEIVQCEGIRLKGFLQSDELAEVLATGGCLVLPSHYEPWGLVVHEGCSSGLPLLVSDAVGSASVFLEPGQNGFQFTAGDIRDLNNVLRKFMALDDHTLQKMGEHSAKLSLQITPKTWVETLLNFEKKDRQLRV